MRLPYASEKEAKTSTGGRHAFRRQGAMHICGTQLFSDLPISQSQVLLLAFGGHAKLEATPQPSHWVSGRAHPYGWVWWSRAKDSRVFGQGINKDVALWAIYRPSIGQEARAGAINQIRTKNETEHVPQEKGQTMSTSHCQCKGAVNEHWPSPPSLKK